MKYFLPSFSSITVCFIAIFGEALAASSEDNTFPENFMLGAVTSAYQTEGAWNESGKGPSIWDTITHTRPEFVSDRTDGSMACDSFRLYKEDIQLAKILGIDFYRFSISWPRILPEGHVHIKNNAGIEYYNNVIDELKKNNIEPVVTMYHWDLPQRLQDLGGWANPIMADYFEDYAYVLFSNFGARVKWWITINEPCTVARGYGMDKEYAPAVNASGIGNYMALHTLLMAHANVYRLYSREFKKKHQGNVGISFYSKWYEPDGDSTVNLAARDRVLQFELGSFAHPIFSDEGDYPAIVKETIERKSKEEGYTRSRLPMLSPEQIRHIRGTSDFFGLNHYTTTLVKHKEGTGGDVDAERFPDPEWTAGASYWLKVVPTGFRKLLNWIKDEYNNPQLFVTENGFSDVDELHDIGRIRYYISYMCEMLKAIKGDHCNVFGYAARSLIDNFEWSEGYTERFGLYYVNFTDPNLRRIPKDSVYVFSDIAKTRQLRRELVQVISEPNNQNGGICSEASTREIASSFLYSILAAMLTLMPIL